MWRLLLSGLLCVPALVLLIVAPRDARNQYAMDAPFKPFPMTTVADAPVITVALSPALLQGDPLRTDPDSWELALADDLAAAAVAKEPVPPPSKPTRVLRARAAVARNGREIAAAQATPLPPQDTPWARWVHWLAQHQAPKTWSPGGGEGAG
jgi:hypothetical protein